MENILNKCSFLLVVFLMGSVFFSCKEDPIGQMPIDKIPPKPVSNPVVTNLPGGAKIQYQLPDETDLLYVKSYFTLPNGTFQEVRTSSFANTLEIRGFGKATTMTIPLISVDRSRNESEPVYVDISPEDSPIYDIRQSLYVIAGFGGFKIDWLNPLKSNIVVEILKKDEEGDFRSIESFYSSEEIANKAVRGQEAVESEFEIFVRDTYNNYTDTLNITLTPWYETQLDKSKFAALPRSSKFELHNYGNSNMSIMWDGNITPDNNIYYIMMQDLYPPYFAFDMGVKAKLSRFRLWTRYDYIYQLHAPKEFTLYGTNDPVIANNPDSDNSEWIELVTCSSYRPSGLSYEEPATGEDRAYANAGDEFEFPLEAPEVRYIRFQSWTSWSGTWGLFVSELTFWGSPE